MVDLISANDAVVEIEWATHTRRCLDLSKILYSNEEPKVSSVELEGQTSLPPLKMTVVLGKDCSKSVNMFRWILGAANDSASLLTILNSKRSVTRCFSFEFVALDVVVDLLLVSSLVGGSDTIGSPGGPSEEDAIVDRKVVDFLLFGRVRFI